MLDCLIKADRSAMLKHRLTPRSHQRSGTIRQLIFPSTISSHATLAGEPRLGRVTQPGFRNKTGPRLSFRGTCVCPCNTASTSFGGCAGGICWRRNFNPPRTRSTTSGHSKLVSQFPRTRVISGPIAPSSSKILSAQTSPRCQISSASLAIWLTFSGKRLCVSARTKTRGAFLTCPAFFISIENLN